MRIRSAIYVSFIALIVSICLLSQVTDVGAAPTQQPSRLVGVWRGQFDGLPAVDRVITDDDHRLHGAILFYLHIRPNSNSPFTSKPGLPEPIFNLRFDSGTLAFQVSHRRAHPPGTLNDAPKNFGLKFTGPDQAELVKQSGGAPPVAMKRSDY